MSKEKEVVEKVEEQDSTKTENTLDNKGDTPKEETAKAETSKEQENPPTPKTMKKLVDEGDDNVIKVDLSQINKDQDAVQEETQQEDKKEEPSNEEEQKEEPVLEKVEETEEEKVDEKAESEENTEKEAEEKLKEETESVNNNQEELPENVTKLVDFMKETGGTLEDYIKLNKNYEDLEDIDLLKEHYKQTKPHLNDTEINFLIEDSFSYNEEEDDDKNIQRKKLRMKEAIAEAKSNLTSLKSRYYDEVKLSSKLTPKQKEAVEFFNKYNQEQESTQKIAQKRRSIFENKTNNLFSENFKGFEYKVGESKYRFNIKDKNNVKDKQSDINNLVNKFVDKDDNISDATGYHKALFTAMNADAIANHFYEQGRADAIKTSMAKSKNVDMNPRGTHEAITTDSGFKVRAVSGEDSSKLRIKLRN